MIGKTMSRIVTFIALLLLLSLSFSALGHLIYWVDLHREIHAKRSNFRPDS